MYSLQELKAYMDLKDYYFGESYEGHMVIDKSQQMVMLSKGLKQHFGMQNEKTVMPLNEWIICFGCDEQALIKDKLQLILTGVLESFETMVSFKDAARGASYWVHMKKMPFKSGDMVVISLMAHGNKCRKDEAPDATKDILTGAYNRTYFNYVLASRASQTNKEHTVALAYLDIQKFHKINENMGLQVGDLVLKAFFKLVHDLMPSGGIVARNGADQALVLLEGAEADQEVLALLDALAEEFRDDIVINGHRIKIQISAGVSIYPELVSDLEELVQSAEIALLMSKNNSHENYQLYDRSFHESVRKTDAIYEALENAIANQELELYFQPLYNTQENAVYGAEVLLRWHSSSLGVVSPAVFIPLAEESNLIVRIGNWVMQQTFIKIKEWQDLLPSDFVFSINVSPVQIRETDFMENLVLWARELGAPFSQIQIELTESIFVNDYAQACEILNCLRALGIHVAMDDFGTGYSSLNHLRSLPMDVLKIDKLFTDEICTSPKEKAIAKTIVELAKVLQLDVIAEGVETMQQLETLKDIGCNKIQGYLIDKPSNAFTFIERMKVKRLDTAMVI